MKAEYNISKTIAPDDWRGMRLTLDGREGETSQELMDRVAKEVDTWFFTRYGLTFSEPIAGRTLQELHVEKPIPEDERKAALIADIYACKTLEKPNGLESYRTLADQDPLAKQAFDIMFKKLSK